MHACMRCIALHHITFHTYIHTDMHHITSHHITLHYNYTTLHYKVTLRSGFTGETGGLGGGLQVKLFKKP